MKNILIYDSGIGGIAILKQIRKYLLHTDCIYYADNANFPYGNKEPRELVRIVKENLTKLMSQYSIELVVLACNTITGVAIDYLRREYPDITFVGTEPSIKQALLYSASNILVLATHNTVCNQRVRSRFPQSNIIWWEMPSLAEFVERGMSDKIIRDYVEQNASTITQNYDCVVIGCTHYSQIKDILHSVFVGKKIFDGSSGVAQYVKALLQKRDRKEEDNGIVSLILSQPSDEEYDKYMRLIRE